MIGYKRFEIKPTTATHNFFNVQKRSERNKITSVSSPYSSVYLKYQQ